MLKISWNLMIVVFCQLIYSQDQTQEASDTLRIKSDKTEYEIIIVENGFNQWMVCLLYTSPSPRD